MKLLGGMFDDPMDVNVVTVCPSFVEIHSTDVGTGIGIIRRFKGSYASEECSFTISGKDCKFISSIVYPEVKVDGNVIKISGSGVKAKIANLRQKLHDVKLDDAVKVNVNVSTLHKVKKYCETGIADEKYKGVCVYKDCVFATNNKTIAHIKMDTGFDGSINIPVEVLKYVKGDVSVLTDRRMVYFKENVNDQVEKIVYSNLIASYSSYAGIDKFVPKVHVTVNKRVLINHLKLISMYTESATMELVDGQIHVKASDGDHFFDFAMDTQKTDAVELKIGWNVKSVMKCLESYDADDVEIGISKRVMLLKEGSSTYISAQVVLRDSVVE